MFFLYSTKNIYSSYISENQSNGKLEFTSNSTHDK